MPTLEQHFSYLETGVAEAAAAPLSVRKARLAIALIDAYLDRQFAAGDTRAQDVLAFRKRQIARSDALARVVAVAAGAAALQIETTGIKPGQYDGLSEAEYMVSLYNEATVPKLMIADSDGSKHEAQATLAEAIKALSQP